MTDTLFTKTGEVKSCIKFREGTGAKGPWTLYKVRIDDEEFSAFDDWTPKIGTGGDWKYKQETKGKYTNKTLISFAPKKGVGDHLTTIYTKLDDLYNIVEGLAAKLEDLEKSQAAQMVKAVREIKAENEEPLPF